MTSLGVATDLRYLKLISEINAVIDYDRYAAEIEIEISKSKSKCPYPSLKCSQDGHLLEVSQGQILMRLHLTLPSTTNNSRAHPAPIILFGKNAQTLPIEARTLQTVIKNQSRTRSLILTSFPKILR